jgi:redox-sensitive bicupin YhaK (pirin superfamily)
MAGPAPTLTRRQAVCSLAAAVPGAAALAAGCRRAEPARPREVVQLVDAEPRIEGAGVRLRRSLGTRALPLLDPFLMLDEFHSDDPADYAAGFPSHPHRGFETVTYMREGAMEHRDSLGNHGRLGPGSTQWMTAGHGIIHSEMPQQERGLLWGFQLWVNLPAAQKMVKPRYQDLAPARIVELAVDDAAVRLVAGEAHGRRGPVDGIVTAPQMLDVQLPARGTFRHALPPSHNAFVYVFEGTARIGAARTPVAAGQLAVLGDGDGVTLRSDGGARMLCLAGQPIGEPVARYGPFVMNTEAELRQAIEDYQSGRLVDG